MFVLLLPLNCHARSEFIAVGRKIFSAVLAIRQNLKSRNGVKNCARKIIVDESAKKES